MFPETKSASGRLTRRWAHFLIIRVLTLLVALFPIAAVGCECRESPIDATIAEKAKSVFLFRLTSANISKSEEVPVVEGEIQIVSTLRGDSAEFRRIRYSISRCCGIALVVGNYYYAFTSEIRGPLLADSSNILNPGQMRGGLQAKDLEPHVRAMIEGKKDLPEELWFGSWASLQIAQQVYINPSRRCLRACESAAE